MKFRKKPIVIEAIQISKHMSVNSPLWWTTAILQNTVEVYGMGEYTRDVPYVLVNTPEGIMRGECGDWIIQGVKGELYPCKIDIFEATYEPVDDSKVGEVELDLPNIGSVWKHSNGNVYRVTALANITSTRLEAYPVTVVYENVKNGTVWARKASDWHGSMTKEPEVVR